MKKIEKACIIDDDPIFIYGTKRLMAEIDFCETLIVYQDGQDAIDGLNGLKARGEKLPSIILLDLNMPIMNGWEFLEDFIKISNDNREDITVYIISSSVDPRDLERIKNYEVVNNYILKPISTDDLRKVLKGYS